MELNQKQLNYYKKWGEQSQYRWRSILMQIGIFTCCYAASYILIFEIGFELKIPEWSAIYRPIFTGLFASVFIVYSQYRANKKKYKELQQSSKLDF